MASVAYALRPELCLPQAMRPRQGVGPFLGLPPADFGVVRTHGLDFSVPMWVEEVAPGGLIAPDASGANAEHGAAIIDRLVAGGAAMCKQLRDTIDV